MSQLKLTAEEQAMVASALRTKSAQYLGMFGVADPALDALLAKVEGQLPAPVVESAATEVVEPEVVVEATEETPAAE
jgi:hypothetical protein